MHSEALICKLLHKYLVYDCSLTLSVRNLGKGVQLLESNLVNNKKALKTNHVNFLGDYDNEVLFFSCGSEVNQNNFLTQMIISLTSIILSSLR